MVFILPPKKSKTPKSTIVIAIIAIIAIFVLSGLFVYYAN